MELRWTPEAAADLERITDYLFEHAPESASELVRSIYEAPSLLLQFPQRVRVGRMQNTRELVLSRLPDVIVYRIGASAVQVLRILHGAQK